MFSELFYMYAESKGCNIEYISGSEQHTSTWAKLNVQGLQKWAVREKDGEPQSDKHSSYSQFVCLDVPEGTIFTVWESDGDKYGTDTANFWICKASPVFNRITAYGNFRHCTGNFEVVCHGEGKTKAPRLLAWWGELGDRDPLAYALWCAQHIDKRGRKEIPPMPQPQPQPQPQQPQPQDAVLGSATGRQKLAARLRKKNMPRYL